VSSVVLVTGANGFAGSHLVEHLAARQDLVAWSRSAVRSEIARLATWQHVDLLDRDQVRRLLRDLRPAAVYHCAGSPHVASSWRNTTEPLASNVLVTHHLLDGLRRLDAPCRVVIPGSATVYASSPVPVTEADPVIPGSPYAFSKLAQEQLGLFAAEDRLEVIVSRSFNHTGPRQSPAFAAPHFARQIAAIERGAGDPIIKVGNLDATRDVTDVRDTVRAYALLMERGVSGTVYNIASGVGRTIRSLLDALVERSRKPVRIEIDREQLRPHDTPVLVGNADRLHQTTGWRPMISFERMIDDLLEYWRAELTRRH
jgi:GDP-4-dehydro-6-deoxy-D-mannose reductase